MCVNAIHYENHSNECDISNHARFGCSQLQSIQVSAAALRESSRTRNEFGSPFAHVRVASLEKRMKFSREFNSEQQAEAQEIALKAAGYQAWRKHAPDGRWQVFWLVPTTR